MTNDKLQEDVTNTSPATRCMRLYMYVRLHVSGLVFRSLFAFMKMVAVHKNDITKEQLKEVAT